MNQDNKYPDLIIRSGTGCFSSEEIKFVAPFDLMHYPQKTIIYTQLNTTLNPFVLINKDFWELNGEIDQNIPISAQNLHLNRINNKNLTFQPFKEIKIGDSNIRNFQYAEFPLVGFYDGMIDLTHENWQITNNSNNKPSVINKTKSDLWGLQLEGLTLTMKKDDATIEEFQKKANDITLLLSLAVGNNVIFNRQLFFVNNELKLEFWQRKTGYEYGVKPCIASYNINYYIEHTIRNFERWSKKKKDTFYAVVNYINSSSRGHLEDRILRLCIAWECLATSWTAKENIINEELNSLKEFLKKAIGKFELSKNYDKSFIKERVLRALDWEKLHNTLMKLINQYRLDYDKIGLDFKTLIKIRNDIAHYGQFRKKYTKEYLADLIFNNKLGLQILLLRELGYDKFIETHENKWKKTIRINELLTEAPLNT